MHSWVFRNRARLRALYGVPEPEPALYRRPRPLADAADRVRTRPAPGTVVRRRQWVVLIPMRRRAV